MTLQLVNPTTKYSPPHLIEPPPYGYVHIGAVVEPPKGRVPFPGRSAHKKQLLRRLAALAARLSEHPEVVRATAYRATLIPPIGSSGPTAAFDVAVLVEATSPAMLDAVCGSDPYVELVDALKSASSRLHVMRATCVRCIHDVNKTPRGTYLFNHFVSELNTEDALALWEALAGWYAVETALDNSTLLAPADDGADYIFVNHARWEHGLAWVMFHQLTKRTFRTYVLANLRASQTTAMPVLYRVVS
jgi:hypothetical protein